MADGTILTVRLPNRTKDQLATLAGRTRRTSSFLAAEAIGDYVAWELAVVDGIEQGRVPAVSRRTQMWPGLRRC